MCQDLWDGVTSQRAVISETRLKLLDTKVFFQTVLNLVSAAAETAFNADAEFVATGLNDKLNKWVDTEEAYSAKTCHEWDKTSCFRTLPRLPYSAPYGRPQGVITNS
jgi:hypothetical protein